MKEGCVQRSPQCQLAKTALVYPPWGFLILRKRACLVFVMAFCGGQPVRFPSEYLDEHLGMGLPLNSLPKRYFFFGHPNFEASGYLHTLHRCWERSPPSGPGSESLLALYSTCTWQLSYISWPCYPLFPLSCFSAMGGLLCQKQGLPLAPPLSSLLLAATQSIGQSSFLCVWLGLTFRGTVDLRLHSQTRAGWASLPPPPLQPSHSSQGRQLFGFGNQGPNYAGVTEGLVRGTFSERAL